MGYTHYWSITDATAWQAAWPQVVADATRIVQEAGVALASYRGPPVLSVDDGIVLNGVEPEDYETFHLDEDGGDMGFCKTAHRPYDVVVTAVLLRASMVAGKGLHVASDGTWEEWKGAEVLVGKLWPDENIANPFEKKGEE